MRFPHLPGLAGKRSHAPWRVGLPTPPRGVGHGLWTASCADHQRPYSETVIRSRALAAAALTSVLLGAAAVPAQAAEPAAPVHQVIDSRTTDHARVTVATLDAGLSGSHEGDVLAALRGGQDPTAQQIAATLQRTRPDVVVLTGVDVDGSGATVEALRSQYLEQPQEGGTAIDYQYAFAARTNAGVASGADLDGDGTVGNAGDALGYGEFEGQGSFLVLSRLPIDRNSVRTFSHLLWKDVPGNHLKAAGYSPLAASTLPLHSTSLWDIPLDVDGTGIHLLATSATPAEDASGADRHRQADQLSFLSAYARGRSSLSGIHDDQGRPGPLAPHSRVIVAGALGGDADQDDAGSAPVSDLVTSLGGDATAPTWGSNEPKGFPAGIVGDPLRRMLADSARSTRAGAKESGRLDYVIASTGLDLTSAGLEPAVSSRTSGATTRLVWASLGV